MKDYWLEGHALKEPCDHFLGFVVVTMHEEDFPRLRGVPRRLKICRVFFCLRRSHLWLLALRDQASEVPKPYRVLVPRVEFRCVIEGRRRYWIKSGFQKTSDLLCPSVEEHIRLYRLTFLKQLLQMSGNRAI